MLHRIVFASLIITTTLVAGGPAARAQTAQAATPAPETPWYEVEVIVFRQWEAGGGDAERWPTLPPAPQASRLTQLAAPESSAGTPFARLPADQLKLRGVYDALAKAGQYEPLLHLGWRQPGLSEADAPAVAVPPGWQPPAAADGPAGATAPGGTMASAAPPELRGLIKVYRERFLHAQVALHYGGRDAVPGASDREAASPAAVAPPAEGISVTGNVGSVAAPSAETPAEPVYVHQQSRRMRSGELHYLDHPVLGVLVQVRPVEGKEAGAGR